MKSTKYRKHYASKIEFPTRITKGSAASKGGITIGHVPARRAVEQRIGRRLDLDTKPSGKPKIKTHGNNWVFYELRNQE